MAAISMIKGKKSIMSHFVSKIRSKKIRLSFQIFIDFIKKVISTTLGSILVLLLTFYSVDFGYRVINQYAFNKFSEQQLKEMIAAQVGSHNFAFQKVKFNDDAESIAVLVDSELGLDEFSMNDNRRLDIVRPAVLAIFEPVLKNPLEKILFESELYNLNRKEELIPFRQGIDYMLESSNLKVIDLFNDGNEEVFLCINYATGGSGTSYECTIYDGKYFYAPFPKDIDENARDEMDCLTIDQCDSKYEFLEPDEMPKFSSVHSDTLYVFDDEKDQMIFMPMIWEEEESHSSPHLYEIYAYMIHRLPETKDSVFQAPQTMFVTGGYIRQTTEDERGLPIDALIKDFILK